MSTTMRVLNFPRIIKDEIQVINIKRNYAKVFRTKNIVKIISDFVSSILGINQGRGMWKWFV